MSRCFLKFLAVLGAEQRTSAQGRTFNVEGQQIHNFCLIKIFFSDYLPLAFKYFASQPEASASSGWYTRSRVRIPLKGWMLVLPFPMLCCPV